MKNLRVILILSISILWSSCSTNEDLTPKEESSVKETALIEKVTTATDSYILTQKNQEVFLANKAKWWEIALADLIGGAVGYLAGGPVGGVILGVGCSVAAGTGIAPPNNNNGGVDNDHNVFDYAGIEHVTILHNSLTRNREAISENGVFNASSYLQIVNESSNSNITIDQYNYVQHYVDTALRNTNELSVVFSNMGQERLITRNESQVLTRYFQGFENTTNFSDFINFSVSIENIVQESEISVAEKNMLLFTMATARHDLNYW